MSDEHTPLFTDEESPNLEQRLDAITIADSADVANLLYIKNKMESQVAKLQKQKQEAMAFYDKRIESTVNGIKFLLGKVEAYLRSNLVNSLVTHNGTVSIRRSTTTVWPSDDLLVSWAKTQDDASLIRVKEEPDKAAIAEYILRSGKSPDGYSKDTKEKLVVRKAGEVATTG